MDLNFTSHSSLKKYLDKSNYLYIIYSEYGCKIGFSKSPLERIEQIKLGLPSHKCFFIGLYLNEKALTFEKKLHKKFKVKQISHEWFILNDNDLEYIHDYLSKNDFKCLIKKSIIWANYLLPSIYVTGKVKIVSEIKHNKKRAEIQIPKFFTEIIELPNNDDLLKNEAEYFTASEISKIIETRGFKCAPETTGQILTKLGFNSKSKRIPGIGPRKVYYIKVKNNVP